MPLVTVAFPSTANEKRFEFKKKKTVGDLKPQH